jgi:hypothetical protein
MEGENFLTINPETLSSKELWSYRDLQKLCIRLQLGGRGTREELCIKLTEWNRARQDDDSCMLVSEDCETIPMNVVGNNFSILPMSVITKSKNRKEKKEAFEFGRLERS